jgi:hypothetical protein
VKARDNRRPMRRRTPEELAREHEEALRARARLRAEANGDGPDAEMAEIPAPPAAAQVRQKSERSRFAAAIARAEFGRFYFKETRLGPSRKPPRGHNGKAD